MADKRKMQSIVTGIEPKKWDEVRMDQIAESPYPDDTLYPLIPPDQKISQLKLNAEVPMHMKRQIDIAHKQIVNWTVETVAKDLQEDYMQVITKLMNVTNNRVGTIERDFKSHLETFKALDGRERELDKRVGRIKSEFQEFANLMRATQEKQDIRLDVLEDGMQKCLLFISKPDPRVDKPLKDLQNQVMENYLSHKRTERGLRESCDLLDNEMLQTRRDIQDKVKYIDAKVLAEMSRMDSANTRHMVWHCADLPMKEDARVCSNYFDFCGVRKCFISVTVGRELFQYKRTANDSFPVMVCKRHLEVRLHIPIPGNLDVENSQISYRVFVDNKEQYKMEYSKGSPKLKGSLASTVKAVDRFNSPWKEKREYYNNEKLPKELKDEEEEEEEDEEEDEMEQEVDEDGNPVFEEDANGDLTMPKMVRKKRTHEVTNKFAVFFHVRKHEAGECCRLLSRLRYKSREILESARDFQYVKNIIMSQFVAGDAYTKLHLNAVYTGFRLDVTGRITMIWEMKHDEIDSSEEDEPKEPAVQRKTFTVGKHLEIETVNSGISSLLASPNSNPAASQNLTGVTIPESPTVKTQNGETFKLQKFGEKAMLVNTESGKAISNTEIKSMTKEEQKDVKFFQKNAKKIMLGIQLTGKQPEFSMPNVISLGTNDQNLDKMKSPSFAAAGFMGTLKAMGKFKVNAKKAKNKLFESENQRKKREAIEAEEERRLQEAQKHVVGAKRRGGVGHQEQRAGVPVYNNQKETVLYFP